MKQGYFWPVYGELDKVCFPFFDNRRADSVVKTLGLTPAQSAVLLSDGYSAYENYARKTGLTHAQCWAHYLKPRFIWSRRAAPQILRDVCPETAPHKSRQLRGIAGTRAGRASVSTACLQPGRGQFQPASRMPALLLLSS